MLDSSSRVLLTGSQGYLARFLKAKLRSMGASVMHSNRTENNLLDRHGLEEMKDEDIDYIIHTAAVTRGSPYELFETNNLMGLNILDVFRRYFPDAVFVTFGTSASYPRDLPRVETNYLTGKPEALYEQYAVSKRNLLYGLRALDKQVGARFLYFIPSCLYGEAFPPDDPHFIHELIRKICNAKHRNDDMVELFGSGEQIRDLVYVHDAASIIVDRMSNFSHCEVLNLTSGAPRKIKEYARLVCDLVGYDYEKIAFNRSKHFGILDRTMVNSINYPFTPIEIGMKKAIQYYLESWSEDV